MTTNHEFFLIAPNDQIYQIPTTNSDVYLLGTNAGTVYISRLYNDTFHLDDTFFSIHADLAYDSENNLLPQTSPTDVATTHTFFTPTPLSTTETERSASPARANPNQQLPSSDDDEFTSRFKTDTSLKSDTPVKSNSPSTIPSPTLSQTIQLNAQLLQEEESDDELFFPPIPSFLFRPQSPKDEDQDEDDDTKKSV